MAAAATMTSAGGLLAMLNEDQPALKLHQLTSMTTDDIVRASRLLDNEIRILKEELQRTSLESDSFKEKIKENQEKIKLNKQLPYLVGNIVEILEMNPEEEAEEDGANIDLDSQRKGKCVVLKTSTRQALDRGAALLKVDKLVTGHNVDDIAETVLLNILRGDIARLGRCTSITTGEDGPIPRCKPFKYTYEKEIVMYAYFKKLDYFSTECIYSPNAYRGFAREFIKDLERMRPRAILDIITSGEDFRISTTTKMPEQGNCEKCGYISSQKWCKACVLLEGLNRGLPKMGIGRTRGVGTENGKDMKRSNGAKSIESKQCGSLDF